MKPIVKLVVGFSVACAVACFGVAVYRILAHDRAWVIILWTVLGILGLLPILPAKNRRIRFEQEEFTYRTWLGNEYRFRYTDVLWYKVADHDLYLYTAKKRLIVDRDVEDAEPMRRMLVAHDIPNHKPVDPAISDDRGEAPEAVYYRSQRTTVTVVMLSMAVLLIAGLVLLTIFLPVRTETDRKYMIFLYVFFGLGSLCMIGLALFSWNGRVECYRDHFIYRTWLGAGRDYRYSDCASKKVRDYSNFMNAKNRIYRAVIRMQDGSRIRVDNRMIEDGLGASINFRKLPKQ